MGLFECRRNFKTAFSKFKERAKKAKKCNFGESQKVQKKAKYSNDPSVNIFSSSVSWTDTLKLLFL